MCDCIAHRGPDDAGYVFFRPGRRGQSAKYLRFTDLVFHTRNQHIAPFGGPYFQEELRKIPCLLGMGHRRLAVIDLTVAGHQPMPSGDRRFWLSFNGEVFNFPKLRDKLNSLGHEFYGRSDTEVILHLWEEYGERCLPMLNGMFALAVYDMRENVLTLARDRFGVKPLYYAEAAGMFVYASEIKGIFASGLVRGQMNPAALYEYFTFQNNFSNRTLFQGVHLLEPGAVVRIRPGRNEPAVHSRFHKGFPAADAGLRDLAKIQSSVAEAFAEAVRSQLISDVEVGAYLSGGMDSGSIAAVAGRSIARLHTFTCGFDMTNVSGIEQGFDERKDSENLAYHLQTEHYEVVLHSGDMPAAMEKLTWHIDDPRVGMCHQNWYAAKLASKFVKVCLSGAGGDELFAGYPWRYMHGMDEASIADGRDKYFLYWHRLLGPHRLESLFSPDLRCFADAPRESFDAVFSRGPEYNTELSQVENMLEDMLHFEFKTFLHGLLLIEDKISMAHGLEVRVPFLDNTLVDMAFRIPPSGKLDVAKMAGNGGRPRYKADEGKTTLRKAMRKFLPERFTSKPKQGFSPPDNNWYRGESMNYIKEILYDPRTLQRPWFDNDYVKVCLEEHFCGQHNHRLLIWSLLHGEWLQRHYCDV
jgi:asparagine synthase (glutamine-hydrolysing)